MLFAISHVPHQLNDITALFFYVPYTVSLSIWPEVLNVDSLYLL